jgi:hypothetical protein
MTTNTISNATRASALHQTLTGIIRPKDCSDRTAFRRVAKWLADGCNDGRFDADIFPFVLDLAREAAGPECRNPAAVFMSLLKRELGYTPKGASGTGK